MALGSSGQISIGDINEEKGLSREAANSSLTSLSTTNVNSGSVSKPDGARLTQSVNFIVTTILIHLYLPHQASHQHPLCCVTLAQ